jgi:hypothetical protein
MCAPGFSDFTEVEPNQPCAAPQALDANLDYIPVEVLPLELPGELQQNPDSPLSGDVDFFLIETEPGTPLRAEALTGEGTEWPFYFDPLLGLFDLKCNLIASNDNYYSSDSRIDFTVPEGGGFILGVTATSDSSFIGDHPFQGFYRLRLVETPEPIGGIGGRVIDAVTGGPLWGLVSLYYCVDGDCETVLVQSQHANSEDGAFNIESGWLGPLDPGEYRLAVEAMDYDLAFVGPFKVHSGEDFDVGAIELKPTLLYYAEGRPCYDLASGGDVCRYTVGFYNNTDDAISLRVWSLVQGLGEGFGTDLITEFPAMPRFQTGLLDAHAYKFWQFSFRVPDTWPEDLKFLCPKAWAADDNFGFLGGLLGDIGTFCIAKDGSDFEVLSAAEATANSPLD